MNVLTEAEKDAIEAAADERIADLIMKNREGQIKVDPGYDGVYGELIYDRKETKSGQSSLGSF